MKIRVNIEWEVPAWLKHGVRVGLPVAILVASGGAFAAIKYTYKGGDTLLSADMTDTLGDLNLRLQAVEAPAGAYCIVKGTASSTFGSYSSGPAPSVNFDSCTFQSPANVVANASTAWQFVVPSDGRYLVSYTIGPNCGACSPSSSVQSRIFVDGMVPGTNDVIGTGMGPPVNGQFFQSQTTILALKKGQKIGVGVLGSAVPSATMNAGSISVSRIGL